MMMKVSRKKKYIMNKSTNKQTDKQTNKQISEERKKEKNEQIHANFIQVRTFLHY